MRKLCVFVQPDGEPGHIYGTTVMMTNGQIKGFHSRVKQVTAVSPVMSVYCSICIFRKYCVSTPMMTSQTTANPTCDVM